MTKPESVVVADPGAGFQAVRAELVKAFEGVLDGGRYILGEHVAEFERRWASFCEVEQAVGVSSGTDALAIALRAVGVSAGDEVLVPAMTATATWTAVSQIGAVPIGVDIEPVRNGMDPDRVHDAVSPRTRALVAVHLFGRPADVRSLSDAAASAGIPLIEDAAQAQGARVDGRPVGSFGALASFSFYPTKNLSAMGDAGAVTTSDAELADRVRVLREYGWRTRGDAELKGVNARLDELQAALLTIMLDRLDAAVERRRAIAGAYLSGLADLPELELPARVEGSESAWHLFVVRHPRRDELARALAAVGVRTAVHYSPAAHLNRTYVDDGWRAGAFPTAERHAATALTIPLHLGLADQDVERVVGAVHDACLAL